MFGGVGAFFGCSGDAEYKAVDFAKTVPIAQPETKEASRDVLRLAVAAMISPWETFVYYKELLYYIGKKSGFRVQLIQRKTYEEVNELFPKGQIDLAFICTGPFAASRDKFGFEALATPQVRGQPYYQSYLIVPKDSSYQKFEDLKGRVVRKSQPFGSPPLVASARLSSEVRLRIQELMLSMHTDSEGERILEKLLIDRFVAPREEWYEPARAMIAGLPAASRNAHAAPKP